MARVITLKRAGSPVTNVTNVNHSHVAATETAGARTLLHARQERDDPNGGQVSLKVRENSGLFESFNNDSEFRYLGTEPQFIDILASGGKDKIGDGAFIWVTVFVNELSIQGQQSTQPIPRANRPMSCTVDIRHFEISPDDVITIKADCSTTKARYVLNISES